MSEPISTKTVMIFKDPNKIKRDFNHQVVLPSPSKAWRRPYTKAEQKDMVEFMVERRAYSLLGGNTIWQQMEEAGACGGKRTWQSMKEHFKKQSS